MNWKRKWKTITKDYSLPSNVKKKWKTNQINMNFLAEKYPGNPNHRTGTTTEINNLFQKIEKIKS